MEDVKNKMPMHKRQFFTKLENYLDAPLYYFGSIQRYDYYPDTSDIDAILFTNNVESSKAQLQNWFQVSKHEFKQIVNYLPTSKRIAKGYKLTYTNNFHNISTDILIYNVKDKEYVEQDCQSKVDLPFFILTILVILKTLHYQLGILSFSKYIYLKRLLMDIMDDGIDFWKKQTHTWKFLIFDIPKKQKPKEET
jgi:hypothetical protein